MNSASDGAIREMLAHDDFADRSYNLINEFFAAVSEVFESDWKHMTPKTSRLVHGAGIVALGYVMELLYSRAGATTRAEFKQGLSLLKKKCAWAGGTWKLSESEERPWNAIQNTPSDIDLLSNYLVRELKRELRRSMTNGDLVAACG